MASDKASDKRFVPDVCELPVGAIDSTGELRRLALTFELYGETMLRDDRDVGEASMPHAAAFFGRVAKVIGDELDVRYRKKAAPEYDHVVDIELSMLADMGPAEQRVVLSWLVHEARQLEWRGTGAAAVFLALAGTVHGHNATADRDRRDQTAALAKLDGSV